MRSGSACDGLMLGGQHYRPEKDRVEMAIDIKPGEIAILSTCGTAKHAR